MMGQSETLSSSQIQLLHSFMHVHTELLCALPAQPVQLRWTKTISWSQTAVFWHFFIQILVCRITYDHPWRCSYKIVNQACYNMVPNLLVQCKLCDSSTTESQWGSKGRGTCGCVGSHNLNIYKLTVDMEFSQQIRLLFPLCLVS